MTPYEIHRSGVLRSMASLKILLQKHPDALPDDLDELEMLRSQVKTLARRIESFLEVLYETK